MKNVGLDTNRNGQTTVVIYYWSIIPRLHEEAYMKQTANMKQTYSKYTCTTCAPSLLHVCFLV